MESGLSQVLLFHPYPASYCGESKHVSNKYGQAHYIHPLQLCQSQVFYCSANLPALNHAPSHTTETMSQAYGLIYENIRHSSVDLYVT